MTVWYDRDTRHFALPVQTSFGCFIFNAPIESQLMSQPTYPNLAPPEYFDYQSAAAEAGITPDQLATLYRLVVADYAGDLNLAELRLLRTCRAVRDGHVSAAEAIRHSQDQSEAA